MRRWWPTALLGLVLGALPPELQAQEGGVPPLVQATLLYEQGRFSAAAEVLGGRAVEEQDPLAYLWWGMALYRAGVLVPAMEAWGAAETSPAWAPTVHFLVALTHWQSGQAGEAREWLARCAPTPSCTGALGALERGERAPPPEQWAVVAGLRQAVEQRFSRVSPRAAAEPLRRRTLMAQGESGGSGGEVREPGTASLEAPGGTPIIPAPPAAAPVALPPESEAPAPPLLLPRFRVGEPVRVRSAGGQWRQAEVLQVGEEGERRGFYRVRESGGAERWYYQNAVASAERHPSWTEWFQGVWDVRLPGMEAAVPGIPPALARGVNLAPLRVEADGTYLWAEGTREIRGRWVPRRDAPGIVLQGALYGADWVLYNATEPAQWRRYGTEVVVLQGMGRPFLVGLRMPG